MTRTSARHTLTAPPTDAADDGGDGPMRTVAACDGCGRGYCWVSDTNRTFWCLDVHCGGRIWILVTPECMDDDNATRARRRCSIAESPGYVVRTVAT